jgi:putative NADPH-quinone reductase
MPSQLLILDANPSPHSLCAALATSYARGAARHTSAEIIRLADLTFDPVLRAGYEATQPWEPDLERAAAAIQAARHIVIVSPTWWAGPPAILKGFIDRIFLPGWAYKFEGKPLPTPLLAGRSARLIITMDSPSLWYRLVHSRALHAMLIRPTLRFVGIKDVTETTIYKVRDLDAAARAAWISRVEHIGAQDALRACAKPQSFLKKISSMV